MGMKRFLRDILLFLLPMVLYALLSAYLLPRMLGQVLGPGTQEQVDRQFTQLERQEPELLVLGNSRMYVGVDPDELAWPAFNFAHDNDAYDQAYYKLKHALEQGGRIRYVVLGTDVFQFSFVSDKRDHAYADHLGREYLHRNGPASRLWLKTRRHLANMDPRRLRMLWSHDPPQRLKENGQLVKQGQARETDRVVRDVARLQTQVTYFERILDLCRTHDIRVAIVMPPVRRNEMDNYSTEAVAAFDAFILGYVAPGRVDYLCYRDSPAFSLADYVDITHLSAAGARKFSRMLNEDLKSIWPEADPMGPGPSSPAPDGHS